MSLIIHPRLIVDDVAYRRFRNAKSFRETGLGSGFVSANFPDKAHCSQVEFDPTATSGVIANRQRLKVARIDTKYAAITLFDTAMVKLVACWDRANVALINQNVSSIFLPFVHLSAITITVAAMLPYPAARLGVFDVLWAGIAIVMTRAIMHGLPSYQHSFRVTLLRDSCLSATFTPAVAIWNIGILVPPLPVRFWRLRYTVAHAARLLTGRRAAGRVEPSRAVFATRIIPQRVAL